MRLQLQSALSILILTVNFVICINSTFGKSNFKMVSTNVTENPTILKFNITVESYKQICLSEQHKLNIQY
jgi:hypothetical protein